MFARRISARGFTLLELLVVMVIIGLLAGYVGPKYFDQADKAAQRTAKAQIESFKKSLATYRLETGRFPTSDQGLNALIQRPGNEPKWQGPYLDARSVPLDPWSHPYIYRSPGKNGADYDIISLGKDGQPGGTGFNTDIVGN